MTILLAEPYDSSLVNTSLCSNNPSYQQEAWSIAPVRTSVTVGQPSTRPGTQRLRDQRTKDANHWDENSWHGCEGEEGLM